MLNIDELIIIYIILNYQINKRVIRVVSCYPITNCDPFIICVVFVLANTIDIDCETPENLNF